jgi:ABC-type sugar transport system ATPase subunit
MRGIVKRFGGQLALRGVNFQLQAGETHILAGENGAGKSTLMKILAGVYEADHGNILLNGNPTRIDSPQVARNCGIAIIHQELSIIPGLTVMDNVFLGRERSNSWSWMNFAEQRAICMQLFGRLRLKLDPHRAAGEYPIAVQQLIEIAKALAFNSRIIVMDEPTSALSTPDAQNLFSIIAELKRNHYGIVYISHKMDEIYRIGDRVTVLRDGGSIATAPLSEAPRERLVHWMVGREISEQFIPHRPTLGDVRLELKEFTVPDPSGMRGNAVDGVSLRVRAGEVLGLGGLQGSGSTELLNGLFGTYGVVTSGSVTLDGKPFVPGKPRKSIVAGLALLTNDRKTSGLVMGMSIACNATLAALPKFSPLGVLRRAREVAWAQEARQSLRIKAASLELDVNTLSGGNQQKVVLAKWLAVKPGILLLDEPTRGVDIGAKQEIYELMDQWRAAGFAIVLITTEMTELLSLSDRIIVLHRGRITAELAAENATQECVLQAAMGFLEKAG